MGKYMKKKQITNMLAALLIIANGSVAIAMESDGKKEVVNYIHRLRNNHKITPSQKTALNQHTGDLVYSEDFANFVENWVTNNPNTDIDDVKALELAEKFNNPNSNMPAPVVNGASDTKIKQEDRTNYIHQLRNDQTITNKQKKELNNHAGDLVYSKPFADFVQKWVEKNPNTAINKDSIAQLIKEFNHVPTGMGYALQKLNQFTSTGAQAFKSAFNYVTQSAANVSNNLYNKMDKAGDAVRDSIQNGYKNVEWAITDKVQASQQSAANMMNNAKNNLNNSIQWISNKTSSNTKQKTVPQLEEIVINNSKLEAEHLQASNNNVVINNEKAVIVHPAYVPNPNKQEINQPASVAPIAQQPANNSKALIVHPDFAQKHTSVEVHPMIAQWLKEQNNNPELPLLLPKPAMKLANMQPAPAVLVVNNNMNVNQPNAQPAVIAPADQPNPMANAVNMQPVNDQPIPAVQLNNNMNVGQPNPAANQPAPAFIGVPGHGQNFQQKLINFYQNNQPLENNLDLNTFSDQEEIPVPQPKPENNQKPGQQQIPGDQTPTPDPAKASLLKNPLIYFAAMTAIPVLYAAYNIIELVRNPVALRNHIIYLDALINAAQQKNVTVLQAQLDHLQESLTVIDTEKMAQMREYAQRSQFDEFITLANGCKKDIKEIIAPSTKTWSKESAKKMFERLKLGFKDEVQSTRLWLAKKAAAAKGITAQEQRA